MVCCISGLSYCSTFTCGYSCLCCQKHITFIEICPGLLLQFEFGFCLRPVDCYGLKGCFNHCCIKANVLPASFYQVILLLFSHT